jgi:hypothetical protein
MTAFLALLRRDLKVALRTAPFLLGTLTQPILVVLVFGNLLPRMGLVALPLMMLLMHEVTGANVQPRWVGAAAPRDRERAALRLLRPRPGDTGGAALRRVALPDRPRPDDAVFISEALRYAVTPEIPAMSMPFLLLGLAGFTLVLFLLGARQFERRTIL